MTPEMYQLELEQDAIALKALGYDPDHLPNERARYAYGVYHYNQTLGAFVNLPLFLKEDALSVDVGANVGQYSIKLAAHTRHCLSIEPAQSSRWLSEALPSHCTFLNVAAGERSGRGLLRTPLLDGEPQCGIATLLEDEFLTAPFEVQEYSEQETLVRAVDEMASTLFPGQEVGFIKIDVEGYETKVLEGCRETLKHWRPSVQVEVQERNLTDCFAFFNALDYVGLFFFNSTLQVVDRFDPKIHPWDDFFFIPK